MLHPGHVDFLTRARSLGDRLIVGLNSDVSVRLLKGPDRPVFPEADRAMMLRALRSVDEVVIFDDPLPLAFLAGIRPDVHCKGDDRRIEDMPEAPLVRSWGGEVVILPRVGGWSTTGILAREGVGRTRGIR